MTLNEYKGNVDVTKINVITNNIKKTSLKNQHDLNNITKVNNFPESFDSRVKRKSKI